MENITLSDNIKKRNGIVIFLAKKQNSIIEIISALFILIFLYTALSKSIDISRTKNALDKTPWLSSYALEIAWGIVFAEYIVVALLFVSKTRKVGLYASFALMILFTGYIIYMKAFAPQLPCSCGGVISKMTWNQHLAFNVFSIILALLGIVLIRKQPISRSEESIPVVFT